MAGSAEQAAPNPPKVAVVTGASRGAGRGIAIGLGAHGCKVFVTGRSENSGDHALPPSHRDTHKLAPRRQYPNVIR